MPYHRWDPWDDNEPEPPLATLGVSMAEAAETVPRKSNRKGLWTDLLDVDKFVRVNNLQPITNPVFLDRRMFTPDGLLSNEIFGISQYDRKNRFAYIDLAPYHYMNPLAAVKLASYDRTLADCLYARGRYKLTKEGELISDPDGSSGPEFLYQIWGKVKIRDKTTVTTKEIQKFYENPRDKLFVTKWPVIPPFYRDINIQANSNSKGTNIINHKYASIISYAQSLAQYQEAFANMTQLTQARIQTLLVDIYNDLMIQKVKGSPSKFGMLRRSLAGKNLPYTARLVITAPDLNRRSLNQVQVKFGYATLPLMYVCSLFMPFMIHHLKAYFDAQFIQGGKAPVLGPDGKETYITFSESFDENYINNMILKFINSPSSRFDPVVTPPDMDGKRYNMMLTGRFNKNNTSFTRSATLTDVLYIVAMRVVADKHVFCTRYPLDNPNGQFPARIIVSTTVTTEPVTIGETIYEHYPVIKGDPMNAFFATLQFSTTMLGPMGGDYDGDQCSIRPVWTKEANEDCERALNSNAYILNIQGKSMREMGKDFLLTQYLATSFDGHPEVMQDINKVKPKYVL